MAHLSSVRRSATRRVARDGAADVAGAAVHIDDLDVRYGDQQVLDGAALHVPDGTVLSLLGPSGCGKTTLLRSIAGLVEPQHGWITLGDQQVFGPETFVAPERRRVGMVFQDWALFPHLSVLRNVGFGLSRAARRAGDAERALQLVGLSECTDRLPSTLSGGQQQRVALARALATRPRVLLLDEPFSNLDAALRTQLRQEVVDLLRSIGTTTIFVTHDQEEAFVLGDEVALMLDGRVQQQGQPVDLYESPRNRQVADFVGDANLLPGAADGRTARTIVGDLPLQSSHVGAVAVLVRPEQLRVNAGDALSVERVEYYGHDAVYVLGDRAGGLVRVRILERPTFRRGDQVAVHYTGGPTLAYPAA